MQCTWFHAHLAVGHPCGDGSRKELHLVGVYLCTKYGLHLVILTHQFKEAVHLDEYKKRGTVIIQGGAPCVVHSDGSSVGPL